MMVKDKGISNNDFALLLITSVVLFMFSIGIGLYNDQRIDKIEGDGSDWLEFDNRKIFDECCLNGNELICPKGFMKVAIIFINGSEVRLDMSSFKMCNTHTSFALGRKHDG